MAPVLKCQKNMGEGWFVLSGKSQKEYWVFFFYLVLQSFISPAGDGKLPYNWSVFFSVFDHKLF